MNNLQEVAGLPVPARPTFFFFTHTSLGYGHLARCHKIAREFVERAPFDAHVISSEPDFSTRNDVPSIHEVSLPSLDLACPDRLPDALPTTGFANRLGLSTAELSAHKSRLLLGLVRHLSPLGILLDNFPFSAQRRRAVEECADSLAFLRDQVPATLRCAGFRGVSSHRYPQDEEESSRLLHDYVDLVFIYVDPRERRQFFAAHPFLAAIEAKTRFVGYIGSRQARDGDQERTGGGRVLATFGAGIDAYRKIRLVCDAFLIFAAGHPDHSLHVVTGGRLPDSGYREIERCYDGRGPIRVTRFLPGLPALLGRYGLVVSMSGYNTCVELYQSSTRSIVLPRVSPGNDEQLIEALKFREYGGIDHVVDAAATSPDDLARLMESTVDSPPARRQPLDAGGARTTVEIILDELAWRAGRREHPDSVVAGESPWARRSRTLP